MADISNNPFVDHTASVAARYPSIENVGSPSPSPYTNWVQPQQTSYGQAPQQQYQQPQLQQPQQPQYGYSPQSYQQTGYQSQPSLGQPSQSGFSQQQQYAQPTGYNPGYAQQPQPQQFTGYPQQQQQFGYPQQQQPQPTGYGGYQPQPYGGNTNLAQFDPYSNLGQTLGQQHQTGSVSYPNPTTPGVSSSGPQGQEHPRQYIQSHKVELEGWDTVSWRQCINAFDALMEAWKQRQLTIEARIKVYGSAPNAAGGFFGGQPGYGYGVYGGHNPQAQEVDRLNGMLKEARNNVDTTAAAKFQMTEVQGSYRHSSDAASKRRVREATNAAVQGLPDWPSNNF